MPVEKHLKLSPRYTCTRVRTCDLVLPVIRVLKHQRPVNPRGWGTFQGWYLWAGVLWCPVGYCLSASPNQTLSSPLWSREFEAYITCHSPAKSSTDEPNQVEVNRRPKTSVRFCSADKIHNMICRLQWKSLLLSGLQRPFS